MVIVVPVFEIEQRRHLLQHRRGDRRRRHGTSASTASTTSRRSRASGRSTTSSPGNLGWPVFDTAVGTVGVYICYDRHFPEGWRALGLAGAQLVYNPSATSRGAVVVPVAAGAARRGRRQRVLRRGDQPGRRRGVRRQRLLRHQLLRRPARPVRRRGRQSTTTRNSLVRDLDFDLIDEVRQQWAFYRDRRPDAYGRLVQPMTADRHARPARPHRAVLPDWLAIYYDEPIEIDARRGPARLGRRRQPLPRLLRRHPHHDDRARAARGHQGGQRAGREDPPLLHALPQPADGRAGRARSPGCLGHPRRPGLLHHLRHRGQRHRAAAGHLATAAPTRSWRCATATTAGPSPRSASPATGLVADLPLAAPDATTCTAASAPAARSRGLADAEFIDACVADLRGRARPGRRRRRRADRRADPGRRRVHLTARRAARAPSARCSTEHGILWISDEVQTGWGRTGEHFWGWQAHAQGGAARTSLTFAKGIGNGMSMGGVVARAEIMNCLDANSISTFGGSPDHHGGRRWPTCATCWSTTCRATPRRVGGSCSTRLRRSPRARRSSARSAAGA